jgi:hypothetical protein
MSLSRSKIPYLTHVWNVAVGCNRGCPYCWARDLSYRIGRSIDCELCEAFVPHVHTDRWHVPGGKSKAIGLGFMTDLGTFMRRRNIRCDTGETVSGLQVWKDIYDEIRANPHHVVIVPTREPEGLLKVPSFGHHPDNMRYLLTATNQGEVKRAWDVASKGCLAGKSVLNLEPLTERIELPLAVTANLQGVIVGAMSSQGAPVAPCDNEWVHEIVDWCDFMGTPVYVKQLQMGGELSTDPNEWPEALRRRELPWSAHE